MRWYWGCPLFKKKNLLEGQWIVWFAEKRFGTAGIAGSICPVLPEITANCRQIKKGSLFASGFPLIRGFVPRPGDKRRRRKRLLKHYAMDRQG
jgi:hypothetical protein